MFEIGDKLKLKSNFDGHIENDVYNEMSLTLGLESVWMDYDSIATVSDTLVTFNKDMTEWQSVVILKTDNGKVGVEVKMADDMFENMGKKYNDIDDFRKPNESESRDVNPPEKSDKKEKNDKSLLEYLAKKYNLNLDEEKKSLEEDKKFTMYMSQLEGYAKNIDRTEKDCNKCIDNNDEACIYSKINKELGLTSIACSTIRGIDILVNHRDLSKRMNEEEK